MKAPPPNDVAFSFPTDSQDIQPSSKTFPGTGNLPGSSTDVDTDAWVDPFDEIIGNSLDGTDSVGANENIVAWDFLRPPEETQTRPLDQMTPEDRK